MDCLPVWKQCRQVSMCDAISKLPSQLLTSHQIRLDHHTHDIVGSPLVAKLSCYLLCDAYLLLVLLLRVAVRAAGIEAGGVSLTSDRPASTATDQSIIIFGVNLAFVSCCETFSTCSTA